MSCVELISGPHELIKQDIFRKKSDLDEEDIITETDEVSQECE